MRNSQRTIPLAIFIYFVLRKHFFDEVLQSNNFFSVLKVFFR